MNVITCLAQKVAPGHRNGRAGINNLADNGRDLRTSAGDANDCGTVERAGRRATGGRLAGSSTRSPLSRGLSVPFAGMATDAQVPPPARSGGAKAQSRPDLGKLLNFKTDLLAFRIVLAAAGGGFVAGFATIFPGSVLAFLFRQRWLEGACGLATWAAIAIAVFRLDNKSTKNGDELKLQTQ